MFEIDFEVAVPFEFVGDCPPSKGRTKVVVEGITYFWNQDLITFVGESHEDG